MNRSVALAVICLVSSAQSILGFEGNLLRSRDLGRGIPLSLRSPVQTAVLLVEEASIRREGRTVWDALDHSAAPVQIAAARAAISFSRIDQLLIAKKVLSSDITWDAIRFGSGWTPEQREAFEEATLKLIRRLLGNQRAWVDLSWKSEREAVLQRLFPAGFWIRDESDLKFLTGEETAKISMTLALGMVRTFPPTRFQLAADPMPLSLVSAETLRHWLRSSETEREDHWRAALAEARDRVASDLLIAALERTGLSNRSLPPLLAAVLSMTSASQRQFALAALSIDSLWEDPRFMLMSEGMRPASLRGDRSFAEILQCVLGEDPGPLDTQEQRRAVARRPGLTR